GLRGPAPSRKALLCKIGLLGMSPVLPAPCTSRSRENVMELASLHRQHGEVGSSVVVATSYPSPGGGSGHAGGPWFKNRGRGPLLWGMGGTLLSALGFIGLAMFEQYNGMLTELRNDLKHFNEVSAEFVKKESMQRLRDQLKVSFKEIEESAVAR